MSGVHALAPSSSLLHTCGPELDLLNLSLPRTPAEASTLSPPGPLSDLGPKHPGSSQMCLGRPASLVLLGPWPFLWAHTAGRPPCSVPSELLEPQAI